jgi:hypothetical protein
MRMGTLRTRIRRGHAPCVLGCAALSLCAVSATAVEPTDLPCSSAVAQAAPDVSGTRIIVPDGAKPHLSPDEATERARQGVHLSRASGSVRQVSCAEFVPVVPGVSKNTVPTGIATWFIRARGSFVFSGPPGPGSSSCRSEEALIHVDDSTGSVFGIQLLGSECTSADRLTKGR